MALAFDFEYPVISKRPTYNSGAVSIGLKTGCGDVEVPLELEVEENDLNCRTFFFFRMPNLHLTFPIIFSPWWGVVPDGETIYDSTKLPPLSR